MKITSSEERCKNMADVCRLAHIRTIKSLEKYNLFMGKKHKLDKEVEGETTYGAMAQRIFNKHYDYIINITGI